MSDHSKSVLRARISGRLARAVRAGVLRRATACEHCGAPQSSCGRSLGGHHRDYSRPLDVAWLCNSCHGIEHGRMAQERVDPWRNMAAELRAVSDELDILVPFRRIAA